jgi:hypothetical protein
VPKWCWPAAYAGQLDRSIEPPGAVEGVAIAVADGEAGCDGVGEAAVDGLELGVLGACVLDVGALPHAVSTIAAAKGANRLTRFVAVIKGSDLRTKRPRLALRTALRRVGADVGFRPP